MFLFWNHLTYASHPLQRPDAQQPHRGAEHVPRTQIQPHTRTRTFYVRLALNDDRLPRTRDCMREAERKRDYAARFVGAQCCAYDIRVRAEQERNFACGGVLRERLGCNIRWRGQWQKFWVLAR